MSTVSKYIVVVASLIAAVAAGISSTPLSFTAWSRSLVLAGYDRTRGRLIGL
jgi:hypothetical protein